MQYMKTIFIHLLEFHLYKTDIHKYSFYIIFHFFETVFYFKLFNWNHHYV